MTRRLTGRVALLLALTVSGWGCREDAAARGDDAAAPRQALPAESAPGPLRTVAAEPVHGRTGPGERPFEVALRTPEVPSSHARSFGTRTLGIGLRLRAPDLSQYPCTSCHLGRGMVLQRERITDAHQNIQPLHPAESGATCGTCHAADDVALLVLDSGERATLDHAYRLCAQCHFAQVESWVGGAHGKRLDVWQGRRVVMGCADCHDPHAPALEQRIPFRPPRLPPRGGHKR